MAIRLEKRKLNQKKLTNRKGKNKKEQKSESILFEYFGKWQVLFNGVFIGIGILSFVFLLNGGGHIVLGEIYINGIVVSVSAVTTSFSFWLIKVLDKIWKIFFVLTGALFLFLTVFTTYQIGLLWKDKSIYDKAEFSTIIGKPMNIYYNRPERSKKVFIDSFEINGFELEMDLLPIEQTDFDSTYKDNDLLVKYLPNSHLVVELYAE